MSFKDITKQDLMMFCAYLKEYAEFQYRRRHRQRRRGDMSSLRSNTPDLDDPDSASGTFLKMGYLFITSQFKF